ncbi:Cryptochrome DASH, chloroplastic/mitochondrial [Panicum miliaceum]|uniref:Cryptochrome DASH, chloroplastic/mitochondrial n=1 Tax=Panicum miliaceum TaxID=4540 RepID=A0A3L6S0Z3_PANMI|nr:Cryptochrome DASH, chloroplastic/mitochondrial [Panicum miliaceum]
MSAAASSSSSRPVRGAAVPVPSLGADETDAMVDEAFQRHTSPSLRRGGTGVAVVWFRNDLRVLDNEALVRAWAASEAVLPVFCVDPRVFEGSTHYFGFPKTGALRAQFLIECLGDLKYNLKKKGLDLLVYAHKETCSEEFLVECLVRKGLEQVQITQGGTSGQKKSPNPRLQLIWGATMYHIDDLPFTVNNLPDVYTQFRKVKRYEKQRVANDSTYWVLFELIWRDYFRFLSAKYGNSIFHLGGPRKVVSKWSQDQALFESWRDGRTGYPLIDANMRELSATGFMSNRGRQIVCSFLVRDMGIDWRMGAEWFETCLLDYDPASNYGNWTYGAGVGNDPREYRYFSIPKQAKAYDPEGKYVAYWLRELRSLAKERRNFPGASYIRQIVPLKFDGGNQKKDQQFNRQRRPNMYGRQHIQHRAPEGISHIQHITTQRD